VKSRIRELHFALDTGGADDPEIPARLLRVLEQGGLAHPWFSVQDQGTTAAACCGFEHPVE
jgi:hypothetical protein